MADTPNPTKPVPPKSSAGSLILWAIALVFVVFIAPAVALLLMVGMVPSIVAYMIDKTPKKYAFFCVGSMNICGVFPSLMELWTGRTTISHAIDIIGNVFELTVIYSAAAFGWLIYMFVPPVIGAVIAVIAQHRIAQLRVQQRDLIGEWGEGIAERLEDGEEETP